MEIEGILDENMKKIGVSLGIVVIIFIGLSIILTSPFKVTGQAIAGNEYEIIVLQNGLDGYEGTEDTMLHVWAQENNYGASKSLTLYTSGNLAPLMKFDFSSVPQNAHIKNATLMLYLYKSAGTYGQFDINELIPRWDEGNVDGGSIDSPEKHGSTYLKSLDYYDDNLDILWSRAGARQPGEDYVGLGDPSNEEKIGTFPAGGFPGGTGWISADITDYVKGIVNNGKTNNGFIIHNLLGNGGYPDFYSSEADTQDLRPKLVIELDTGTPLADAEDIFTISWRPGQVITLDASASYDSAEVGDSQQNLIYDWHFTKIAYGSELSDSDISPNGISGALGADTPSFIPDKAGNYELELTVTNSQGHSNVDIIKVQALNIPEEHPRIWLTTEKLARLQEHKSQNTILWQNFISSLNSQQTSPLWGGLGYQIIGDESYCRSAIDVQIEALSSYATRDCTDFNVQCSSQLEAVSLVYDWCNDVLTEEEKDLMLDSINSMAQRTGKAISGFHNYAQANMLSVAYAGIATAYEGANSSNWLDNALNYRYERKLLPLLELAGPGGGWPEGTNYASFSKQSAMEFAEALYTGAGVDIYASNPYYHDELGWELTMDYPIDATSGSAKFRDYPSIGDGERQRAVFSDYYRIVRKIVSDHYDDNLAKQLRYYLTQNEDTRLNKPIYNYLVLPEELIFTDPNAEVQEPNYLVHYANGTGQIFIKSDKTENATYVSFQAGDHFKYHQHLDQGGFTIFKYADLATESGNYQGAGRQPQEIHYNMKTVAHNSLLIYDPVEVQRLRAGEYSQNDGGQRAFDGGVDVVDIEYWNTYEYDTADITKYQDTNNFVYAFANLTNAYTNPNNKAGTLAKNGNSQKVELVEREFVYLKPKTPNGDDAVIIFDRVKSTNKDFKKSNLVHFYLTPSVSGTETKIEDNIIEYDGDLTIAENGNGKLFVKSLLPLDKKITKIGSYAIVNLTRDYVAEDGIMYLDSTEGFPDSGYIFFHGNYVPYPKYEAQEYLRYSGKTDEYLTNVETLNYYNKNPSNHSAGWESAYITSGFYVYGEVYNYFGEKQGVQGVNYLPWDVLETDPTYGTPRIEISPLYNETYDNFLNVLYPTYKDTESMPETQLITSTTGENMQGTLFDNRLVMFAKNPETILQTQYTLPDTGPHENYIFDLQPNSFYEVDVSGEGSQRLTTSNEGALTFTTQRSTVTITLEGQATCSDGTVYNSCSFTQPYYCENGDLIENCEQCNCASGSCQEDGSCLVECEIDDDCDDDKTNTRDSCIDGVCKNLIITPYCGDGSCNDDETCSTCPEDCGACQSAPITPTPASGGGGGGGGPTTGTTYVISNTQLETGFTKPLEKQERFKFSVQEGDTQEEHYLTIENIEINKADIKITSDTITTTILEGQTRKFDITQDDYYDILIKLNSISGTLTKQADITIKKIHELSTEESEALEKEYEKAAQEQYEEARTIREKTLNWIAIFIGAGIVIILVILIYLMLKRRKIQKAIRDIKEGRI